MSACTPESLAVFDFEGDAVRIMRDENGEPWFRASDLAVALGLGRTQEAIRSLDEDEKRGWAINTPSRGAQETVFVSEAGMYSMVLRSRKPEAKRFKRWVTHEVLPQIRKTGGYSVAPAQSADLDFVNDPEAAVAKLGELAQLALREIRARKEAEARVAELAPKADAWEAMIDPSRDYSVSEAAKALSRYGDLVIGRDRMFAWMLQRGDTFRTKDRRGRWYYEPKQHRVEAGHLAVKIGTKFKNDRTGEYEQGNPQIRIPGPALEFWLKTLRKDGRFSKQAQLEQVKDILTK